MKSFINGIVCLILVAAFGAPAPMAQSQVAGQKQESLRGLDEYITKSMNEWGTPGLSIAIVRDDSVIYAKGYGVRELGKPDRVDENTLFAIGSQTKPFTTAALSIL